MAAIDYTVCLHSEVFVTTQGGNFPHFLMGHRRYLFGGHSKTIRPDKRKLAIIFDNPNIGYSPLSSTPSSSTFQYLHCFVFYSPYQCCSYILLNFLRLISSANVKVCRIVIPLMLKRCFCCVLSRQMAEF